MKRIFACGTLALIPLLAACGGGGGGSSSGGGSATLPPTPIATQTPSATIAGKVVQLAGPLAANGTPTAQSTPAAGVGIGGATVYVTAATTAALAAPTASPIATATTAPDGSFSVTIPNAQAAEYGIVAVNGTLGSSGFTSTGFTLGRALAAVNSTGAVLYVDTLTTNEQSGFTAYNAARTGAGMSAITADTAAQMAARLANANNEATGNCSGDPRVLAEYTALGGVTLGGTTAIGTQPTTPFYNTWATQIAFAQQASLDFAGFAGPIVGGPSCPTSGSSLPQNYFSELLITN